MRLQWSYSNEKPIRVSLRSVVAADAEPAYTGARSHVYNIVEPCSMYGNGRQSHAALQWPDLPARISSRDGRVYVAPYVYIRIRAHAHEGLQTRYRTRHMLDVTCRIVDIVCLKFKCSYNSF